LSKIFFFRRRRYEYVCLTTVPPPPPKKKLFGKYFRGNIKIPNTRHIVYSAFPHLNKVMGQLLGGGAGSGGAGVRPTYSGRCRPKNNLFAKDL
jgi:hypothetical protein